jgi:hypothetical protein
MKLVKLNAEKELGRCGGDRTAPQEGRVCQKHLRSRVEHTTKMPPPRVKVNNHRSWAAASQLEGERIGAASIPLVPIRPRC